MDILVGSWNAKDADWARDYLNSHKRCMDTRIRKDSKNPPESEHPNTACRYCIKNHRPCVLVGENGPVVVPLPEPMRGSNNSDLGGIISSQVLQNVGLVQGVNVCI